MQTLRTLVTSLVIATSLMAVPAFADMGKPADVVKAQSAQASVAAQININSADAQTLADRLNGVGLKKAQAIISYRDQHGPFKAVDELLNVAGIGNATLEKNRNLISVN